MDATTGHLIWARSLGKPVPRSALRCGNIDPLGVTGTPVIDEATQSVYLDAAAPPSVAMNLRRPMDLVIGPSSGIIAPAITTSGACDL
jgi:hypothetical protein